MTLNKVMIKHAKITSYLHGSHGNATTAMAVKGFELVVQHGSISSHLRAYNVC